MTDEDAYHFIGCVHVEAVESLPIDVVETLSFQDHSEGMLSAQERADMHVHIALNPEAGVIMPGAGGIRKLRWKGNGKGKSGGYRVIYYYHDTDMPIFLLALYSKGEKIDLNDDEKKKLKSFVRELVGEYKKGTELRLIS